MLALVVDDLLAEEAALDALLAPLAPEDWDRPTPAAGWAIRDEVAHLAVSEDLATLAATDPDAFVNHLTLLMSDLGAVEADHAAQARTHSPPELLEWWRRSRATTVAAVRDRGEGERIKWITGPMSATSFATARLMETWAHGYDVADALGVTPPATPRLRHIADLGVRTRGFSFRNRGLPVPDVEPRVELRGPDDDAWAWGPEGSPDRVEGIALDFCLVVTQRRDIDSTELEVGGAGAIAWMAIAQCFAGPPTTR